MRPKNAIIRGLLWLVVLFFILQVLDFKWNYLNFHILSSSDISDVSLFNQHSLCACPKLWICLEIWALHEEGFIVLYMILQWNLTKPNFCGNRTNFQVPRKSSSNTIVLNHFHSVKKKLFSSARSHDFDGTPGTKLPVSMYTTKTPIDMCRFNVRSST